MSEMKVKMKRLIGAYWLEILLGVFTLAITAAAIWYWGWLTKGEYGNGHAMRTLVFAYGAIGAFYALILNVRRLKINEAGVFNDRLGRGVEAIASKKLHIRVAGVRILENLYQTAEPDKQKLIRESLLDFICNQADIYALEMEKETKAESKAETKSRGWRVDIRVAIKILGELVSAENMSLEEKRVELDMRGLDLRYLNLSGAKLQGADFSGADLQWVVFEGAELQRANFSWANLQWAKFRGANLEIIDLTRANLENVRDITHEEFDKIIYEKDRQPKILILPSSGWREKFEIPKHRAYEWVEDENGNRRRRFVESGEWIDLPPA